MRGPAWSGPDRTGGADSTSPRPWYDRYNLTCVKTAVSVPDDVFEQAEVRARRLGLNRSQLYTRALREYLAATAREEVHPTTAQLNAIYGRTGEPDEDAELLRAAGRRTFARAAGDEAEKPR